MTGSGTGREARELTPAAVAALMAGESPPLLLDVREPWETEICQVPGSVLIPLADLPNRLGNVPPGRTIVVLCHHGVRSAHAAAWLHSQGRGPVINLAGGIDAWAHDIDPDMERY